MDHKRIYIEAVNTAIKRTGRSLSFGKEVREFEKILNNNAPLWNRQSVK